MFKKGAMFGLDARIALAIFGALSVISGAALYSAIESAKLEQYWQSFVEHDKAVQQYMLDNGKQIPQHVNYIAYTPDIVVNRESLSTWKGPYIDYLVASTSVVINTVSKSIDDSSVFQFVVAPSSNWSTTTAHNLCTIGSSDCSLYITIYGGNTNGEAKILNLFNKLDKKIDNADGQGSGRVRFNSVNFGHIMYKSVPYKRTI